jgi:excisionase family DNA binding protein
MMRKKKTLPPGPIDCERYVTVAAVAARYGVGTRTVRNWIRWKWLRAIRKGRLLRISETALKKFDKSD